MVGELEKLLEEKVKTKLPADNGREIKANVIFLSELELATKLADYEVLKNIAKLVRESPYKIDRIVINGGMPYVANRYSKQKGEYIDLLEDRINERYGTEIYENVRGKYKGKDGGVDTLYEAFALAHYSLMDILKIAYEKRIPIEYVISDKDYNNVQMIITALEKVQKASKRRSKKGKKAAKSLKEIFSDNKDIDQSIISFIEDNDSFGVSKWKNKDKTGIKDVAVRLYNNKLVEMLTYSEGNKKNKVIISNNLVNRFEINGVKFNVMHAVNGRYNGNSFVTPLINGQKRMIDQIHKDYTINGKVDDVYVRTHESMLDFTAIEVEDSKPIWLLATPPLQDLNALTKRSESWGKSVDSKRLDQPFDTGVVLFSISNDGRAYVRHISHSLIKSGGGPFAIEKNMKKIILVGDTHVGAPSVNEQKTAYELLEATSLDIAHDKLDSKDRYTLFLGDLAQGGIDKAARSDIIDNKRLGYSRSLESLVSASDHPDYDKILNELRESVYSVSIQNLGAQLKETYKVINNIAKLSSRIAFVNGNHVAKAALHANEADMIGGAFEHIGGNKVDYPDELRFRGEKYEIFGYKANALHTTGYHGGRDGGRANIDLIENTGTDAYLQFAGDEHMLHLNIVVKKDDKGDEKTLVAAKPFAYQDYTSFERDIIKKGPSPRGYAALYVPEDPETIGTKYVIFEAVPETALDYTLKVNGGSTIEKIATKLFLERMVSYMYENNIPMSDKLKARVYKTNEKLRHILSNQQAD